MKGKIIAVLCIIVIFIPSYFALGSYVMSQKTPVGTKVVDKIDICDIDGKIFHLDKNNGVNLEEDAKIIDFFINLNENSKKEANLPEPLRDANHYKITYYSHEKEIIYKYYFSLNPDEAYYLDNNDIAYRIQTKDSEKFISTQYASSLYSGSQAPILLLSDSTTIQPEMLDWKYKTHSGTYDNTKTSNPPDTSTVHKMLSSLKFNFSIKPDWLAVKVYKENELIFDDLYENINKIDISDDHKLTFKLEAKWYENEARGSHGSANYGFTADIQAAAVFYLGKGEVSPGEFVVITGKNVLDASKIKFTSEPSIGYEPKFYEDGEYVHALIPISIELEKCSSYKFALLYEDVEQNMTLNIKDKTFKKINYDISAEILNATRTEQTLKDFKDTMSSIASVGDKTRYWDGLFIESLNKGVLQTGFGLYRTITTNDVTYRHEGVDYIASKGENVLSTNNGKVVYTGELALSGKLIVIEHGYGLKSWYAHLSEINVKVGDTVKKGDGIGKVGASGFTSTNTLHAGLSVFNVPVCPYPLWDEGVIIQ